LPAAPGFSAATFCERLIAEGWRVICVDNLHTGTLQNLSDLSRESRFSLIEADIIGPLPDRMHVDRIYNLACPASPPQYQTDPVHTLLTNVLGMRNLLEPARTTKARILQASTSEVYGDPAQHPQPRPIGATSIQPA
jgi:UDP-glucuronate decarboxylase